MDKLNDDIEDWSSVASDDFHKATAPVVGNGGYSLGPPPGFGCSEEFGGGAAGMATHNLEKDTKNHLPIYHGKPSSMCLRNENAPNSMRGEKSHDNNMEGFFLPNLPEVTRRNSDDGVNTEQQQQQFGMNAGPVKTEQHQQQQQQFCMNAGAAKTEQHQQQQQQQQQQQFGMNAGPVKTEQQQQQQQKQFGMNSGAVKIEQPQQQQHYQHQFGMNAGAVKIEQQQHYQQQFGMNAGAVKTEQYPHQGMSSNIIKTEQQPQQGMYNPRNPVKTEQYPQQGMSSNIIKTEQYPQQGMYNPRNPVKTEHYPQQDMRNSDDHQRSVMHSSMEKTELQHSFPNMQDHPSRSTRILTPQVSDGSDFDFDSFVFSAIDDSADQSIMKRQEASLAQMSNSEMGASDQGLNDFFRSVTHQGAPPLHSLPPNTSSSLVQSSSTSHHQQDHKQIVMQDVHDTLTGKTKAKTEPDMLVLSTNEDKEDKDKKKGGESRSGGPMDVLCAKLQELTAREEETKREIRPQRGLGDTDPSFPLITKAGVPDGWLNHEPCDLDLTKCKLEGPPLVCEGGVRIEWHYQEMMPPQKCVAFAVARAIKLGKHATLEAPTGTGKTAALLCGALAAQRYIATKTGSAPQILYGTRTQGQVKQVVRELKNTAFRPAVGVLGSRQKGLCVNDRAKKHADAKRQDLRVVCQEARKNHRDRVRDPNKITCNKFEGLEKDFPYLIFPQIHPTVTEKRDSNFVYKSPILDIEELAITAKKLNGCPYFVSQAHALTADIVVCPYNYILDPKAAVRSKVELKNRIIILDEAHNIEGVCRDAGSHEISSRLFVVLTGNEKKDTAYVSPMTMLTFNIPQLCKEKITIASGPWGPEESAPTEVVLRQIKRFFAEIRDKMDEWERNFVKNKDLETEAERNNYPPFHRWQIHEWAAHKAVSVRFFIEDMKFQKQPHYFRSSHNLHDPLHDPELIARCLDGLAKEIQKKDNGGSQDDGVIGKCVQSLSELEDVAKAFTQLWKHMDCYAVTFSIKLGAKLGEPLVSMINTYLLAPKVIFEDIAAQAHSIILASGTLCPPESFLSELGPTFGRNQIEGKFANYVLSPLEADHVINANQLFLQKLSYVQSPGMAPVPFTNKATDIKQRGAWNDPLLLALGHTLVRLISVIPEGVLIFLPSYSMLSKLTSLWASDRSKDRSGRTIWDKFIQIKGTVVVEESKRDIEDLQRDYTGTIKTKGKCMLLGVLRAKCSEGISFNDQNARGVIVVGISYPELYSPEVKLKREFNDMLQKKKETSLGGHAWYQQQAFRAINQALGRCIRHRYDYGALFIIDSRWEEQSTSLKLARWLRTLGFRPPTSMENIESQVTDHFRLLEKKRHALPGGSVEPNEEDLEFLPLGGGGTQSTAAPPTLASSKFTQPTQATPGTQTQPPPNRIGRKRKSILGLPMN